MTMATSTSTLQRRLREHIAAAFAGLWVHSFEHEEALAEIAGLCRDQRWRLATWDIDRGLRAPGSPAPGSPAPGRQAPGVPTPSEIGADPLAAIRALAALAGMPPEIPVADAGDSAAPAAEANGPGDAGSDIAPEPEPATTLLVMVNLHRFLGSAEIVQALAHQVAQGKRCGAFVVVLAPVVQLPVELERLFTVIEHDLPDRTQLERIALEIATRPGEMPAAPAPGSPAPGSGEGEVGDEDPSAHAFRWDERRTLLDAAAGLTRLEAENAFALALVRHGRLRPQVLWELKAQMLRKGGLLTLHRGGEDFASLGGLDHLKSFCARILTPPETPEAPEAHFRGRGRGRGVLLLSPPGCGKSRFAKALGNETGRPTLLLDVGSLMGSLVGQTEERTRQALRLADAMAPCVLACDEIDKALAGATGQAGSGGSGDSGVSARLFGTLLTWLADHESDVFFVATCNDVSRLPPEFARAERFDGVFFVDLPGARQRRAIWRIHRERFGIDGADAAPADDEGWTGAEIKACCRLARLLGVPLAEAAMNIVPVSVTAADAVAKLRAWASGRCLSADTPGIHRGAPGGAVPGAPGPIKPRRVARTDPHAN